MGCASRKQFVSPVVNKVTVETHFTSGELRVQASSFVCKKLGSIRDDYKLGARLGSGTFGFVRLATHKETGQRRAVKSINKAKLPNPSQFASEVTILKRLDHPNIVRLYEYYEDAQFYHLVTEWVEGGELFDYIIRRQQLSEQIAASFMKQLLSVVAYCHEKNIVHRDLKPENLLLDRDGPDAILKVIDFGTSVLLDGTLTERFGTAYYIAPEVLSQAYNEKCDVWSCGVILFVLLAGRPPFQGPNDAAILRAVLKGSYSMNGPEWRGVSKLAKDLVRKMLNPNHKARISAAQCLRHKWLARYSTDSPVSVRLLNNLQTFYAEQKLQHAVLAFIGSQCVSQQEARQLAETFAELDKNCDGRLSKAELLQAYTELVGARQAAEEVERIMQTVDIDNSGYIDYTEFIMAASEREALLSKENLQTAFQAFDRDGNGKISAEELKELFTGLNTASPQTVLEEIIREVDKNNDGEIDITEFTDLMLKLVDSRPQPS